VQRGVQFRNLLDCYGGTVGIVDLVNFGIVCPRYVQSVFGLVQVQISNCFWVNANKVVDFEVD
jgi:hypothetical protein